MVLFQRADPDLRSLIAYMHARAEDRGVSLHRTKLTKLLYLVDVECVRGRRAPLTGLEWTFEHHGPHAGEVADTLKSMLDIDLAMPTWKENRLRRGAPEAPDGNQWPASTKAIVDRVMDRFAARGLDELLDHVYFHTAPMRGAQRGLPLDTSRVDAPPRRRRPLAAPERPADVEQRLAKWRRLAPLTLDPPGAFLAGETPAAGAVRGRVRIP